jgi:hypothetical protein
VYPFFKESCSIPFFSKQYAVVAINYFLIMRRDGPKTLKNFLPRTANIAWSRAPEPAFSKELAAEIFLLCSLYLNVYRIYRYLDGK